MRKCSLSKEVAKISDQQQTFLDALKDPDIYQVPARQRYRWAATKAGYSENTPISSITKPLQKQIIEVAERMLMEASISAAWVMQETVDGENIESIATRFKMDAAKEILDRAVPRKENKPAQQAPLVQIMLPAKQEYKIVDVVKDNE